MSMKTREELEEMGFTPEWARLLAELTTARRYMFTSSKGLISANVPAAPLFTPGHEPVSKEWREVLEIIASLTDKELARWYGILAQDDLSRVVVAYRDSLTPKPPEFEGWERNGDKYERDGAIVWPQGKAFQWTVFHGADKLDSSSGIRPTLPEAIKAAEDVMRMLEPDPEGWHKTDGMAPPEDAAGRVIETVDSFGNACTGQPDDAGHYWGDLQSEDVRPIKWRYADGAQ